MRIGFVLCVMGLLFSIACNELEDCQLNPYGDYAVVEFNLTNNDGRFISFDEIYFDGDLISQGDTIFTYQVIPLNAEAPNATYTYVSDSATYELSINYKTEGLIYQLDCEASVRYFDLDTAYQTFDSLAIILPEISLNQTAPNFEIYF